MSKMDLYHTLELEEALARNRARQIQTDLQLAELRYAVRNAVAAFDNGLMSRDAFIKRIRELGA